MQLKIVVYLLLAALLVSIVNYISLFIDGITNSRQMIQEVQKPALETFPSQSIGLWPIMQRRLPVERPQAPTQTPPRKESITLPPCSPLLLTPSLPLSDLETLPSQSFTLRQTHQQRRPPRRPPSLSKAAPNSQRRLPVERPPAPTRAPPRIQSISLPPCFSPPLTPSLPLPALETLPSQSFTLRQTHQQRRPPRRPPSPIKAPLISQRRQPAVQRPPAPTRAPPHINSVTLPPSFPPLLTPSFPLPALETLPSQSFILQQTRQQRRPALRPPSPIKAPPISQRRQPAVQRPPAPRRAPSHKEIITLPSSFPPLLTSSFPSLSTPSSSS